MDGAGTRAVGVRNGKGKANRGVESVAIRRVPALTTYHHLDSRELKNIAGSFCPDDFVWRGGW